MGYRLGLIINPIAGMGGSVGLKGTDGALAARARSLGAVPIAGARAALALGQLSSLGDALSVFTCSGAMGENTARQAGLHTRIVTACGGASTTAADTRAAAGAILDESPQLLLFVGGDGTARDLLDVVGSRVPMLGVPSGVKMHSAVFAASPRAAGEVARRYLTAADPASLLRDAEILDRAGERRSPELFGIVRTPQLAFLVPGAKASDRVTERAALEAAIGRAADLVSDAHVSLIGPGSTMQALKRRLGFEGTPLGVDAVQDGRCIGEDLNEQGILELATGRPFRIVVSVVGGQGFLFGRGNQPLSARVIEAVGRDNIVVVSSLHKLTALAGHCLLVDTGDEALDSRLSGHIPVIVSGKRTVMMPVRDASAGADAN
jgi:predicted polyphosphate/ATP-dependent NAD kinase